MNANANKAPFKQSSAARSPLSVSLLARKLITRSSAEGKTVKEGSQLRDGHFTLFSVKIWKRGETLMMSWGFHWGKWKDSKGKWEHYLVFFPSTVPCCFNKSKERNERGWRKKRGSRLEVSHKAQARAFCSNYRQIGDLDISARWSISW